MHLDELQVYQKSVVLSTEVYARVAMWAIFDRDTLGKQMVRSADSVPLNIAEGYGRFSGADNRKFTMYARGSLFELRTQLLLAHQRRLLSDEEFEKFSSGVQILLAQLIAYSRSIPTTRA
ncbi:MAG: four helix bundle protein [Ignavibacteriae bacterium]|nr:MAG: four helix bundle protein [Ignavibacteriota bacterium]